jgi:DNA-binding NarL/FixJ family response regulator
MRASKRLGRIPVVMLTTSDRPEEVDACYALGCSLYLKKQVDYAKFTEAIGKLAALVALCELPLLGGVDDE